MADSTLVNFMPFGQWPVAQNRDIDPAFLNLYGQKQFPELAGAMPTDTPDLVKQRADSDATTPPATTQVAIKQGKPKKKKPSPPIDIEKELADGNKQKGAGNAGGQQQTTAAPPSNEPPVEPPPTQTAPADTEPTANVQNTPEVQDSSEVVEPDPNRKMIHTVFQTITGKDAIPYGEKWRWYLQHGFTGMHGNRHRELMNQINAESKAFPMAGTAAGKNTYGQELRAQEMKRRTLMNQWDKLLWEWNHGYYSGNDTSVAKFNAVANKLRNAMIAEGISPDLIRDPSINAGGFSQGFMKNMAQNRDDLDWLGGWMRTIEDNVNSDPNWLNSRQAQMEFDKMSEYVILKWAQSKGAIADAEKIRAQVEAMPEEDRKYYNGFMSAFFRGNAFLQMQSLAKQGNQHAKELTAEIHRLVNMTPEQAKNVVDEDGYGGREVRGTAHIMQLIALIKADLMDKGLDLPIDLKTALDSYKASREVFDEYVMRNANVDRQMVWNSAADQMKINADTYNRKLKLAGLYEGWNYTGYAPNRDFANKLAEWQRNDRTDSVIRNAGLSQGSMAGDTEDGGKGNVKVEGGVAGASPDEGDIGPAPKAIADKRPFYLPGDGWYYRNKKGNLIKWEGK